MPIIDMYKQISSGKVTWWEVRCNGQETSSPHIMTHFDFLLNLRDGTYDSKYFNWTAFIAPRLRWRINVTADIASIPNSIKAIATNTGALPNPATQWTAIHVSVSDGFKNVSSTKSSQLDIISDGGLAPSSNTISYIIARGSHDVHKLGDIES